MAHHIDVFTWHVWTGRVVYTGFTALLPLIGIDKSFPRAVKLESYDLGDLLTPRT
ncbi:hypothetical protein J6590_041965, partial [Homalodisca vitripennis]